MLHAIRRACLLALFFFALTGSPRAQTNVAPAAKPPPPPFPTPPADLVVQHDVVFGKGGSVDLQADIAYSRKAAGPGPMPAIIYIHGGGWAGGSHHWTPIFAIAHNGYFAMSAEYRFDKVAKWPAQIQDCKCAVRWLRANAAKYNVDPNRIGAWGESAGGHLVACLGTMADVKEYEGDGGWPGVSSAVQAVVDYYGPTDLVRPEPFTPLSLRLLGVPLAQNPDLWKSASPLYFVAAGDPPVLMIHGDSDGTVPLDQSTLFADALTKAGVPNQLLVIKHGNHGFFPNPRDAIIDPPRSVINQTTFDFLAKYLAPEMPKGT